MPWNNHAIWWAIKSVRKILIHEGLPLPPRSILSNQMQESAKALEMLSITDGNCLALCVGNRLLDRREEFSDPAILLADLKAWHTDDKGKLLAKVPYLDFLETWYWIALSSYVVVDRGGCEECQFSLSQLNDSRMAVQAHHVHYRLRGFELRDLACLASVCRGCHACLHDKETEPGTYHGAQVAHWAYMRILRRGQRSSPSNAKTGG